MAIKEFISLRAAPSGDTAVAYRGNAGLAAKARSHGN
jgi:hypothetical protein